MQVPKHAIFAAFWAFYPTRVFANNTPIPLSYSASPTCATITETSGSGCPPVTGYCARPACIEVKTVTLECGCAGIYSTTACETECGHGCGTTYETAYLPCPVSPPSSVSVTITTSTMSSYPTSITPTLTYTFVPPPTLYPNSTMTTASTYFSTTSSGGGGVIDTTTSVVITTPGNTGPVPTTSPSVTPVQGNAASSVRGFGAVEGGVLIGLIGAVVGMI
jgi:hypothetical protein